MSVILVFLVAIIAGALWWLMRQGITSKPWLETGPSPARGAGPGGAAGSVGLGIFLVVIGALFALFGSAFVMRMDLEAWSSLSLPAIVWVNTALLVFASLFLHLAAAAARRGHGARLRSDAAIAAVATTAFLIGQVVAWYDLALGGNGLATGPAASFFYLLSGLHGLHILGGLVALGLMVRRAGAITNATGNATGNWAGIGACVIYWDFLLVVWAGLLFLFLGWANRLVDICRGVLT